MIDPYQSLTKVDSEEDFEDYLRKIHLFEIFKPLLEEFQDKKLFKGIVRFIVYGYSMSSEMLLTQGNTWGNIYKVIYKKSELPDNEEVFDQVANLKSDAVREVIERFLRFQNDEPFTQFAHFRDLRRQMLAYSLQTLRKASGEIDIQAKMDAAVNSQKLLQMMEDAKETFIQNHPKLRGSVEALNKANKEKNSRSVGSYAV